MCSILFGCTYSINEHSSHENSEREHKKNLCIWVISVVYLDNIGVPMKGTYQRGDQKIEKK